jgi:GTP cyclohydrolase IA
MKFPNNFLNINEMDTFKPYMSPAESLQEAAQMMIQALGENPQREGLIRTPKRFAKAMSEICSGYHLTALDAVGEGVFQGEGSGLVSVREIDFFSLCEHHMLPFWGQVSVAYIPKNKILGLSKIPRLIDVFAKRLQVQERLTKEIATGIYEVVDPIAAAVRVKGSHMCMMMRGVKRTGSETVSEYSIGMDNMTNAERDRIWKSIE